VLGDETARELKDEDVEVAQHEVSASVAETVGAEKDAPIVLAVEPDVVDFTPPPASAVLVAAAVEGRVVDPVTIEPPTTMAAPEPSAPEEFAEGEVVVEESSPTVPSTVQETIGDDAIPQAELAIEEHVAPVIARIEESVVPLGVPEAPVEEGIPQAELAVEEPVGLVVAQVEEPVVHLAVSEAPVEEGIAQAELDVEKPLVPVIAQVEETVVRPAEEVLVAGGIAAEVAVVGEAHVPTPVEEVALEEPVEPLPAPPQRVTNTVLSPPHAPPVVEEGIPQAEAAVEHPDTSLVPLAAEEIIVEEGIPKGEFAAEEPAAPVPPPAEETAVNVDVPEIAVQEEIPQTGVAREEPLADFPTESEEILSLLATSNATVIKEGVPHSDNIVDESTESFSTPAEEFVTLPSPPAENEHEETPAVAPAESNLHVIEGTAFVGVEEEADEAPAVEEPSIKVQGDVEEESPEAEGVEKAFVAPPAPPHETIVPPPATDAPFIEEGIPQAEFTTETHVTPAEETGLEEPITVAPFQAPTETIVAPTAELDIPIVGEEISQAKAAVEEHASPISGSVEETIEETVDDPPLDSAAEESATAVPTSAEETETVPAVLEAAVEEGIPQAEVVAEGSEIPLSGPVEEIVVPASAPSLEEDGISQAEIVEDLDAPLSAPAEEIPVPPSPAIESDHAEAVAVSTSPAAVPEASSEADAPVIVEEAAGVIGVEGPDGLVDEPLVEAPSAPVEIEVDPTALVAPAANEETVPVEVSVPVESVLAVPQASEEPSVPAVAIEDPSATDAPPVGAAANSEEENIGSLVEPEVVVAPEVPHAAAEPAVIEEQHAQDEDSLPLAPEGRIVSPSLLTSLKRTSLSI